MEKTSALTVAQKAIGLLLVLLAVAFLCTLRIEFWQFLKMDEKRAEEILNFIANTTAFAMVLQGSLTIVGVLNLKRREKGDYSWLTLLLAGLFILVGLSIPVLMGWLLAPANRGLTFS